MANKEAFLTKGTPVRYGVWYRCPLCNAEFGEAEDDATDQAAIIACPGCNGKWSRSYLHAFRAFAWANGGYPAEWEERNGE